MFGLISSMFRGVRNLFYLLTGQTDKLADKIGSNPTVVKARYKEIITEKQNAIQEYITAIGSRKALVKQKMAKVKALVEGSGDTPGIMKLETLKSGAGEKAKVIAAELKAAGKTPDEIAKDPQFMRCKSAFADFKATLDEKRKRLSELEADIQESQKRIEEHVTHAQSKQREIEKLKDEQSDVVASLINAEQEKQANDVLANIATDRAAAELQNLREITAQQIAKAEVSAELAGVDHKRAEREFEAYAIDQAASDEFDALVKINLPDDVKISEMEQRLDAIPEGVAS